jgi:RsiW-degrading membrane proteinase PrsW (M82 family)
MNAEEGTAILNFLARFGLSILPVFTFLFGLQLLDSYKLVRLPRILMTVLVGCMIAVLCHVLNTLAFMSMPALAHDYAVFGVPVVEETLKAAYVAYLIRTSRVGFMVDAAICGFAVGAGFSLVENSIYIRTYPEGSLLLWAVRGFGTAMMHGGTTSIFSLISSNLSGRSSSPSWRVFGPGLALAIVIHAAYNQALFPPLPSTFAILVGLPILLSFIFILSEKSLRSWLGTKLDKDIELMEMISTGRFSETRAGSYLRSLRSSFPPEFVGDMFSLLYLSLELSARAKGDLMLREAGFSPAPDPLLPAKFEELAYLEKNIGRAGKLALAPLLSASSQDLWEIYMLKQGGAVGGNTGSGTEFQKTEQ